MNREISQLIEEFLGHMQKLDLFSHIEFIILYGSSISSYHLDESDIDICIYIDDSKHELSKIRLKLLKIFNEKFDIQMYQLLPLYIQIEVLKGKIIYIKDREIIYKVAYETIED